MIAEIKWYKVICDKCRTAVTLSSAHTHVPDDWEEVCEYHNNNTFKARQYCPDCKEKKDASKIG